MTKPVLYEWALDQTSLPPTTQAQWEEGFTYLNAATGGKVPTYVHDYPFSEITKAIRWTLDALPDDGIVSAYVENRFKGNQNWNVAGSTGDPLPSATPTLYTVGSEIVAGVKVITTNADQITYVAGVLNSGNNTGILRRRYAKDSAGLITKTSQYGGIKLPDGSQLQALVDDIATNGVRITEDGSDVVVDVDLSVVTGGFRFFGLSDERGAWADVNDDDSESEFMKAVGLLNYDGPGLSIRDAKGVIATVSRPSTGIYSITYSKQINEFHKIVAFTTGATGVRLDAQSTSGCTISTRDLTGTLVNVTTLMVFIFE